jgi:hypothetical protein
LADLQDKVRVPEKDFILYIRDTKVNMPYGFVTTNKDNEQAFLLNVLTTQNDYSDQKDTAVNEEEEE